MLFLGADHGGFQMKEQLKRVLAAQGIPFRDLGAVRYVREDDFPFIAVRVARAVAKSPAHRGVLLCRSGVGMALAANKVRGIRAVQAGSVAIAVRSRREEDTNVLALASDFLSFVAARLILRRWLREPFRPLERYQRRLQQLQRLDHGVA